MINITNNKIRKDDVISNLRKHKDSKFDVWDIYNTRDCEQLIKHLKRLCRNNKISIIVTQNKK